MAITIETDTPMFLFITEERERDVRNQWSPVIILWTRGKRDKMPGLFRDWPTSAGPDRWQCDNSLTPSTSEMFHLLFCLNF